MNHWLFLILIFFSFGTSSGKDEDIVTLRDPKCLPIWLLVELPIAQKTTHKISPQQVYVRRCMGAYDEMKACISKDQVHKVEHGMFCQNHCFNRTDDLESEESMFTNTSMCENIIVPNHDSDDRIMQRTINTSYADDDNVGTPSWKITKDHLVTIPLNVLGTSRISITSSKEFSPVIKINFLYDMNHILKNQSGLIIVPTGSKIPGNIYRFIIENNDNIIRVTPEDKECDGPIASLNLQTFLKNITASSLDEDFMLTLEPTVNHTTACTIKMSGFYGQKLLGSDPLIITLGVSTSICAGLCLILIIYILRKRKKNTSIVSEIDESDLLLKSNQGEIKKNVQTQTVSEILENEQTMEVSVIVENGQLLESNQGKMNNNVHTQTVSEILENEQTLVVLEIVEIGQLLESNQGKEHGRPDSPKQLKENNEDPITSKGKTARPHINFRERVSSIDKNKELTKPDGNVKGEGYEKYEEENKEKNKITPSKEIGTIYSPEKKNIHNIEQNEENKWTNPLEEDDMSPSGKRGVNSAPFSKLSMGGFMETHI